MGGRLQQYMIGLQNFNVELAFGGLEKGVRMDDRKYEFALMKNDVLLPYCYFNLVYIQKNKGEIIDSENFDIDGFNYMIN